MLTSCRVRSGRRACHYCERSLKSACALHGAVLPYFRCHYFTVATDKPHRVYTGGGLVGGSPVPITFRCSCGTHPWNRTACTYCSSTAGVAGGPRPQPRSYPHHYIHSSYPLAPLTARLKRPARPQRQAQATRRASDSRLARIRRPDPARARGYGFPHAEAVAAGGVNKR